MCGIFFVINKNKNSLDLAACNRGLLKLSKRGPDLLVSNIVENHIFIGQTILSITGELNPKSQSITQSKSGRFLLSYNGEIYNYKELSNQWLRGGKSYSNLSGDTRVLADLHDELKTEEIPTLLDGMFAYCVFDRLSNKVSIARDLQGEKSAFVYEDNELIIVSSEIQSILATVPSMGIDEQALRDYFLTRHFMQGTKTVYKNIRQIQPGTFEQLDTRTFQWQSVKRQSINDLIDPDRFEENSRKSLDYLTDELDYLISKCVDEMLPDRRFAAVISGGVDSSLLAHYLIKQGNPDLLIAVNHVGKDYISSNLTGFENVLKRSIDVISVDAEKYSSEIINCQRVCGSPLPSHSFIAQSIQSEYVQKKGCKVLFGGEGGDEVFGGYDAYSKDYLLKEYSPSPYMNILDPEISFISNHFQSFKKEIANVWNEALNAYNFVENIDDRIKLAMMHADMAYQMANVGLRSADLMSMMHSVETRTIFIRKPLIKFALNLPLFAKVNPLAENRLKTKVLLKRLFLRHYPNELLYEKQGFAGFPNESGLKLGDISQYVTFNRIGIKMLRKTESNLSKSLLWKLANVEYFLRFKTGDS